MDAHLDHTKVISTSKHPIYRVCLTGGPCAGKTTALATLTDHLSLKGFKVLLVPEAATMMMKGGCFIQTHKMSLMDQVRFQIQIMKSQMCLEDIFLETALDNDQATVILCDRGVMDGQAYATQEVWQALLDETHWSTIQLRDRRYEAVIHMVSAADGAPQFYTDVNNEARYETLEEAVDLDKRLINAWVGHPQFTIVDNNESKGFAGKIERCVDSVFKTIGLPTPQTHHKKFLLVTLPGMFDINTPNTIKKEVFQSEETFLQATKDDTEAFIRKMGKNDSYIYTHEIRQYQNQERIQKKRQLTAREYIEMLEQSARGFVKIKKFRQCFTYDGQYFMVETLLNVDQQPSLLRIETSKTQSDLAIPNFVKVLREVTSDDRYAAGTISKIGWKMPEEDKQAILKKVQHQVNSAQ